MSISRRRLLRDGSVLAALASLPPWLADPLRAQVQQPLIRRSVASTDAEAVKAVHAYRAGVAAMKKRKPSEPTSWQFQANMHAWPGKLGATAPTPEQEFTTVFAGDATHLPLARKLWGTCSHGDSSVTFLPWHRLYLYFFERIVRAASGQPPSSQLGLPYWDWSKDRTLPLPFREAVEGSQQNNPLFWDIRRQSVTRLANPVALPAGTATVDVMKDLLDRETFSTRLSPTAPVDFESELEFGPHGAVHVFVCTPPRGMGHFEEAGRDPVFWVHHCNIDRLWSHWRQKQGHAEPLDAKVPLDAPPNQRVPWSDVRHTFVDENGKEVHLTNRQVLLAAEILDRGYTYDDLPAPVVAMNTTPNNTTVTGASAAAPATESAGRTIASASAVSVGRQAAVVTLTQGPAAPTGAAAATSVNDRVLVLQNVAAPGAAGGLYGVYLNLPPNEPGRPESPHFVGTINSFSAAAGQPPLGPSGAASPHAGHAAGIERRLPAGATLARLGWKAGDPIRVTIAPIELDDQLAAPAAAATPSTDPVLNIGKIDIVEY
jgi:tyrosinase